MYQHGNSRLRSLHSTDTCGVSNRLNRSRVGSFGTKNSANSKAPLSGGFTGRTGYLDREFNDDPPAKKKRLATCLGLSKGAPGN